MSAAAGIFVCVVGPSGAGKDTLLRLAKSKLASEPGFSFPRRHVTRPPSTCEDHLVLSEADYAMGLHAGLFALAWRAHGLGYGIGSEVLPALEAGHVVPCNVSREAIIAAKVSFPRIATILVTAPVDILAARLNARGRETSADIGGRLARNREVAESFAADFTIENSGPADAGAEKLVGILRALAVTTRVVTPQV
ncbi:MAG: phosphonate metabolism protein/1,5-bisphosphokinase (PRPP-forming) PhnN [Pseudomonadota bacterium]